MCWNVFLGARALRKLPLLFLFMGWKSELPRGGIYLSGLDCQPRHKLAPDGWTTAGLGSGVSGPKVVGEEDGLE